MPIYEYHCNDCNTDFEQFVRSMLAQETITCPDCGGQHVKKAISLFGGLGGSSAKSGGASAAANCAPTG
jgi:putative FmdB family regulatory protein